MVSDRRDFDADFPGDTYGYSKHRMPVIYADAGARRLTSMRWGVWPHHEKTLPSRPVVNARDDALFSKNIWRWSVNHGRCLIPADGFFEWAGPKGHKWQVLFHLPGEKNFYFAGVWADDPDKKGRGFAIVTTKPNALIAALPHDRMPVILSAEGPHTWIGAEPMVADRVLAHCVPYPGEMVRVDQPPPEKPIRKKDRHETSEFSW